MNRILKFRGLRTDGKGWAEGSLVNNLWCKSIDKSPVTEIITTDVDSYDGDCWEDVINECIFEVRPESVGQFTGLKDKNGFDIYENDVLELPNKTKGIVEWLECGFVLKLKGETIWQNLLFNVINHYTVIGNVHQSKELLTN